MDQACSNTCLPLDDCDVYFHLQELTSVASHVMIEIPTYVTKMLDIALFWFITKHKGDLTHSMRYLHGCVGSLITHSIFSSHFSVG
jgi:hypothetical protein